MKQNEQIEKLQYKINIMAIGKDPDLIEFEHLQNYSTNTAIKSLEENKDMLELRNKIKQVSKFTGCSSQNRRKLIKSAIRVIIDNIVPSRVRVLLGMCQEEQKASEDDIFKLFCMDTKESQVESQKPIYSEIDRLHLSMQMDPRWHLRLRARSDEMINIKLNFERSVHDLIRIRNRLLNIQLEFTKFDNPSKYGFTPANVIKFYEATRKLETEEKFNIWNVYNITKSFPWSSSITEPIDEDLIEMSDDEEICSIEDDVDSQN